MAIVILLRYPLRVALAVSVVLAQIGEFSFILATMGRQLSGRTVPSELANKWAMSFRRPIGVAGIIAPFNFPLAIPTWKTAPALICGNAVVLKPSDLAPLCAVRLVEALVVRRLLSGAQLRFFDDGVDLKQGLVFVKMLHQTEARWIDLGD